MTAAGTNTLFVMDYDGNLWAFVSQSTNAAGTLSDGNEQYSTGDLWSSSDRGSRFSSAGSQSGRYMSDRKIYVERHM